MIKVHYNTDGDIMGFYPDSVKYAEIPTPFIEINVDEYNKIFSDLPKYKVVSGMIKNISDSDEYINTQNTYKKLKEIEDLKKEILFIENSQPRAVREYILNPDEITSKRVKDIEEKIVLLRDKIQQIQL